LYVSQYTFVLFQLTSSAQKMHLYIIAIIVRVLLLSCVLYAQLSHRKGVMPNALWYTDIFGLEAHNRMQKIMVVCFR